jgi:hypothetical protein
VHKEMVDLALSTDVRDDIIWYAIVAAIFLIAVIFAIRSN